MYYTEHEAPSEVFTIPSTVWLGVAALTTVDYQDANPITLYGKFLNAFTARLDIGIFALPAGIIAAGLGLEFEIRDKNKTKENDEEK